MTAVSPKRSRSYVPNVEVADNLVTGLSHSSFGWFFFVCFLFFFCFVFLFCSFGASLNTDQVMILFKRLSVKFSVPVLMHGQFALVG